MTEEIKNALGNLLINQGVYSKVVNVTDDDFVEFTSFGYSNTLDLFCPTCKDNKTFVYDTVKDINELGIFRSNSINYSKARILVYRCPTCKKYLFYLFYYNYIKNEIIKLAQYPSLYDVSRDNLKKYQKNDLIDKESFSQLYKAEECASIGYYIAAYTYMRRVYEALLSSIFSQNIDKIGISEADFKKLRSDEKLNKIKDYLAIDDEIYLPLYKLLSAGIHTMSEEQCCEDYEVLKPILIDILAEQKAKKEKEAKRANIKDLYSKRKGEMK